MCSYKFTPRAVSSRDAPQKSLVGKRARSEGANWVRLTRHPEKQARKPCTAGSQQPACTHKEHQMDLTTHASQYRVGACEGTQADWEKLKKYVPIHKQGDVCPSGFSL